VEGRRAWRPDWPAAEDALPEDRVRADLSAGVIRSIQATPVARVLAAITRSGPRRLTRRRTWAALAGYQQLRRRLTACVVPPPGYQAGFVRLVDGLVRDRLAAIFAGCLPPTPVPSYAARLANSEALTRWIAAPLDRAGSSAAE